MKKPRKRTTREEDTGRYMIDISKLFIGGIVISSLLWWDIPQDILLISGIAAAFVIFILGLVISPKEINKIGNIKDVSFKNMLIRAIASRYEIQNVQKLQNIHEIIEVNTITKLE